MKILSLLACFALAGLSLTSARFDDPDPINNCTMPSCWDLNKCKNSFSVYLYPWVAKQNQSFWQPAVVDPHCTLRCYSLECQRIAHHACWYYTLATSQLPVTEFPEEACVLIPSVPLCVGGNYFKDEHMNKTEERLHNLPYWNGGSNHILWNFWNDWPSPGIDPQGAVVISASFMNMTYRPKFDVSLPLSRLQFMDPSARVVSIAWAVRSRLELDPQAVISDLLHPILVKRDLLLYFKGSIRQFLNGICPYRADLFGKYFIPPTNMSDVIIDATCLGNHDLPPDSNLTQVPHCKGCVNNERTKPDGTKESCTAGIPEMDFTEGLSRAKYGFAPRGCGSQSFRLLETIGLGAVPVVAGYGTFLPFDKEGYIGKLYEQCVIHVPEEELPGLVDRLRGISNQEYYSRLIACLQIATYNGHSLQVLSQQGVCMVAARIASLVTDGRTETWWTPKLREMCARVGILSS